MIEGYRLGLTPNPDIRCNQEIKFGLFLEKALSLGVQYVATGHYVRIATSNQRPATRKSSSYRLYTARDQAKDQSYFLWTLTQSQLAYCLFPIGDYLKLEVREMARRAGLPTAEKKDSQGICFLGKISLVDFLKQYLPTRSGDILTVQGKKIGEHQGSYFYTIGQRRGLGVGGGTPYYVAEKNLKTNTLVVVPHQTNQALYKKEVELSEVNFIQPIDSLIHVNSGIEVWARVRYRQPLARAVLHVLDVLNVGKSQQLKQVERSNNSSTDEDRTFRLTFGEPQKFVAPGQSAVFYSKEGEMLGGGVIV